MSEDRQLINILESQVNESETSNHEVGEQRELNHRYYTLEPLGNEMEGRSHYISPDVLDSAEARKAFFSETFFSGRDVATFTPTAESDIKDAQKRTAYVRMQLERAGAFQILRDGWHDAFIAKKMTVLAEWKNDTEEVRLQVTGATEEQIQQIIAEQGEVIAGYEHQLMPDQAPTGAVLPNGQAMAPTFSGPLTVQVDTSRTELMLAAPERVFRDPNATYIHDAQYFTIEEELARGDLVKRGFDPEQAEDLSVDYRFRSEEEDSSRKAHDRSWTRRRLHNRTDEQELVTVYRTWTWLDLSSIEDGYEEEGFSLEGLRLYYIQWAQGEILKYADGSLAIEEAPEIPAFEWTEYKISHAAEGLADADMLRHTQKTMSTLKRLIIDNQQMRNTTRWEAVQGAVKNPRELLDTSIGGVVWSRAIGSVAPLATPELSPLSLAIIEMMDQDKEERSGVSRLSKGMNNDAVRYQNAADMIERLTNASQMRVMRAARDFAETFLVPLCKYVYRLGVRHDKRSYLREVGGSYEILEPKSWPDMDMDMTVSVAMTPDQGRKHAQTLLQLYQMMGQDPALALGFGYEQRHAMLEQAFDHLGIPNINPYLLRPDSPQYQQKQQYQAQQMEQQQKAQAAAAQQQQMFMDKQLELQMDDQAFNKWLEESKDGREWFLASIKGADSQVKADDITADNARKDRELNHDMRVDAAEIQIERTQKRAASI